MTTGTNLALALRYLRDIEDTRTYGCMRSGSINDQEDRNAQVKRMGNLYFLTYQVVIWLGEDSHDSNHVLMTIERQANRTLRRQSQLFSADTHETLGKKHLEMFVPLVVNCQGVFAPLLFFVDLACFLWPLFPSTHCDNPLFEDRR